MIDDFRVTGRHLLCGVAVIVSLALPSLNGTPDALASILSEWQGPARAASRDYSTTLSVLRCIGD